MELAADKVNASAIIQSFNGALMRTGLHYYDERWAAADHQQHRKSGEVRFSYEQPETDRGRVQLLQPTDMYKRSGGVRNMPASEMYIAPKEMKSLISDSAGACRLIAAALNGLATDDVIARMARFGLLLLQGINPLEVQVTFLNMDHEYSSSHLRSSFLRGIHDVLTNCALKPSPRAKVVLRYTAATRVLRLIQLLCENQCYEWQEHLRRQQNQPGIHWNAAFPKYSVSDNVDIVGHVAAIFCSHTKLVRDGTPTAAAIQGMGDFDVRLVITNTSLMLLQQLADTLCELSIGGNVTNALVIVKQEMADGTTLLELLPDFLSWLAMRQKVLFAPGAFQTLGHERKKMRSDRLLAFLSVELSLVRLLHSLCEAASEETVSRLDRAFQKVEVTAKGERNGFQVLGDMLQLHGNVEDVLWKDIRRDAAANAGSSSVILKHATEKWRNNFPELNEVLYTSEIDSTNHELLILHYTLLLRLSQRGELTAMAIMRAAASSRSTLFDHFEASGSGDHVAEFFERFSVAQVCCRVSKICCSVEVKDLSQTDVKKRFPFLHFEIPDSIRQQADRKLTKRFLDHVYTNL